MLGQHFFLSSQGIPVHLLAFPTFRSQTHVHLLKITTFQLTPHLFLQTNHLLTKYEKLLENHSAALSMQTSSFVLGHLH